MKLVAIILNREKVEATKLARELVPWLEAKGITVVVEQDAADAIGYPQLGRAGRALASVDFAVVLGGDGTLLRASRMMACASTPMLAIRLGKFGFLTDVEPSQVYDALTNVLAGRYNIEKRMMLYAQVRRGRRHPTKLTALNDMVVAKGPLARMLRLGVIISGIEVATYAADGLVVASPTGSTAYSLSAGGPLVTPDLNVLIITPICSHTLNTRSLVVSSIHLVEFVVESDAGDDVMLTADGQVGVPLLPGDRVVVGEADLKACLITFDKMAFFSKLQTRLRWGDRFDI